LDFNKARTFIEVVDSGSITTAANHLLRTQQAISLQLKLLEDEIGFSLFDRQGPKIILTGAGQQFYQDLKPQFIRMENALQNLKADRSLVAATIRIGVWMEQGIGYLPEMLKSFSSQYPHANFKLFVGLDDELEALLIDNKIDLGLLLRTQNKKLLRCDAIYRQPLLPVVSRLFLKTHDLPKSAQDTLAIPLVDYEGEYSAYSRWIAKNARTLLPLARKRTSVVTVDNNVVLKQLVLQGMGFGFLHKDSIHSELSIGELVRILPGKKTKPVQVEIDVVYKRKHSLGFLQQAFVDFLYNNRKNWMR